ncbi:transcription factor CP2-like isoform X4 [Tachypleus tridentatus]|uniref:transcription factor CP2-like isoform X4 n=1 Tax=Tachypleus tridentatus TaxID=6853 RepID=UPI003FD188FE
MSGHWNVDSIGDALAADFDGSLSGLGMELGTGSFNMSDTLMALPTLNSLKQEKEARSSEANNQCNENVVRPSQMVLQGKKNRLVLGNYGDCSLTTKRFCVSTEREATDTSQASRYNYSSSVPDLHVSSITHVFQLSSDSVFSFHCQNVSTQQNNSSVTPHGFHNAEFQYILGAATALGTRKHDETMTYLNQGQSYEIKLKMLGDLTEMRGRLIKSLLKVGFQERRLQFAEKEQITQWQQAHPSERILEIGMTEVYHIDIPLSYGVYEARNDPQSVNKCEFLWDPTKETGVFIRVNCISTEFTPKKHGGEKGVPFYIQVESYNHDGDVDKLHVASCQVKVFKPKGADRKQKTDKERMVKRTQSEQEKFRPSYDCTVLTESSAETLCSSSPPTHVFNLSSACLSIANSVNNSQKTSSPDLTIAFKPIEQNQSPPSPVTDVISMPRVCPQTTSCPLSLDATVSEVSQWLKQNRLSQYIETFTNYCGSDLLRLTRNDIIQICGFADGIRLFSTLQSRRIPPCLTLYVCPSSEKVFRAIFLDNLTVADLVVQLSTVFDLSLQNQVTLCCSGPSDIKVLLTDEVIQNMNDEGMFTLELIRDQFGDVCQVILKPYSP